MKTRVSFIAAALWILPLLSGLGADVYRVGDTFAGFSTVNQQGDEVTFKADDAKFILFDTPDEGEQPKQTEPSSFFVRNRVQFVINISHFSLIKRELAKEVMKEKKTKLLIVEKKSLAERFPVEEGKLTVIQLDEKGVITAIRFAARGAELEKAIEDGKS